MAIIPIMPIQNADKDAEQELSLAAGRNAKCSTL